MSSTRVDITFQEAETTYSKAAKAELHKDLDRAYRFYVKAAADFLHLSQTSTDGKSRSTCKSQAGKAIERAEKIKAIRPDLTPVIKDHFSEQEQVYVLRKSSVVNNVRFPLWDEDPSTSADDTSQPNLSHDQRRNHAEWRRFLTEEDQMYLPQSPLLPQDIIQHIITDCSVCGSIAVCIEHHRRFQSKIGLSCLHPQAPGGLLYSSTMGYFDFRMLFNGAYRRISKPQIHCSSAYSKGFITPGIDDKLPMYPDGSLMCMSTGNKRQIWPALLEKAYMRLMGGYDFPGSNSCIDLHALAGWIPEHLDTRSAEFQREKTWARIIDGFFKGHCLLTLGTGENVSASEPTAVALLPAHCYAVIDVHGTTEDRRLTVLDTWVQPSTSESSVTDFIQGLASSREQLRPSRTFDISWDRACQVFDGIYLSWDPGIFRNQLVFHAEN
ncbi:hypothetical protein AcV5_002096 [Taiwanofungus camphoratus]|nr:hypothetical protein AcV5_002096 [Antrodia cinnamomea]